MSLFRTIPIRPEGSGRVEEVFVGLSQGVKAGGPLVRLDAATQTAAADTTRANLAAVKANIATTLPARRDSAQAALAQAEVALSKMVVHAAPVGRVEQFILRRGGIVNPFMRPGSTNSRPRSSGSA